MVYDAFLFFDELDLLEIRMEILDKVVDRFVICESTETFMGKPKPLVFLENKDRFKKFAHKIQHYVCADFPNDKTLYDRAMTSPNTGNKEHWWVREFYQKESMNKALATLNDDDIVFISDLDEIWDPNVLQKIAIQEGTVYRPIQTAYHYWLNNKTNQPISGWVGTRFATYGTYKKYGANHFRTEREVASEFIFNGGWHFTFMGGTSAILKKIESYSHQEYNTERHKQRIAQLVSDNKPVAFENFAMWKDESSLPEYLITNKHKWAHMFMP